MDGAGNDTSATSLYEIFFDIEDNLCSRYAALSPFIIRREKVGEVLLLIKRVNRKAKREQGFKPDDAVVKYQNGDVHIRRKATNDDWY